MTDRTLDVSPLFCGEYIRDRDTFARFGGQKNAFQCVRLTDPEDIGDIVSVSGPDLSDMTKTESEKPLGLIVTVAGEKLTEADRDVEAVVEKCIPDILSEIKGLSWMHTRDDIEVRVSDEAVEKGLDLKRIGAFLSARLKEKFTFIEKAAVRILTDPEEAGKEAEKARKIYAERDRTALSLHDEDVDRFYFCKICQNACPAHICVISPDHPPVCGTIGWPEAKAFEKAEPEGPISGVLKGICKNALAGEYEGIGARMAEESGGVIERLALYDVFRNPHTTGGCAEIIVFPIPETGGVGLLDRQSAIAAVNGLSFEELNATVSGGRQIPGFQGVGFTYLRSPRFLAAGGGWSLVGWMTESLKKRLSGLLPEETARLIETIPTEKNAPDMKALKRIAALRDAAGNGDKREKDVPDIRLRIGKAPEIENTNGIIRIRLRITGADVPERNGATDNE